MKKLYKVLNKDMKSPYYDTLYEIGKEYHCNNFDSDKTKDCTHGLFATGIDGLTYAFRPDKLLFECNVWGKEVEYDQFKRRYEYIKLTKQLTEQEIKQLLKAEIPKVGYNILEAVYPINPLKIKAPTVTAEYIELLKQWISVRAFVKYSLMTSVKVFLRAYAEDSVRNSVWNFVLPFVRASIGFPVWDSVWDSVDDFFKAYISSLFFNIKQWHGIEHKEGTNPFQPAIDLWHQGLVPSYDGKTWRLHAGQNADVVYRENF